MVRPRRQQTQPPAAGRPGFSLVEMLATVAALVIVLGLMVSLARYVRKQASDQLTKQLLAQLDGVVRQYQGRYKTVPAVPPFVPGVAATQPATANSAGPGEGQAVGGLALPLTPLMPPAEAEDALPDEEVLQQSARLNNRAIVAALRVEARRFPLEFAAMPQAFFEGDILRDAWGTPLVFMPALHPAVGMAMENRPFFLSAGPDRVFRTLEDNLYSYEEEGVGQSSVAGGPGPSAGSIP